MAVELADQNLITGVEATEQCVEPRPFRERVRDAFVDIDTLLADARGCDGVALDGGVLFGGAF